MNHASQYAANSQLTTFHIGDNLFGIEVMNVQEVTASLPMISVPLAPSFVNGLINLRGQIATALGLRELFGLEQLKKSTDVFVVCKIDGNLVSLQVDSIGDVIEVDEAQFERPPETMPVTVRRFVKGIYKTDVGLLSVIDLDGLAKALAAVGNEQNKNLN